eukprot:COSAG05_NODE_297_length_11939_cov_17.362753_13_plen_183_part_00
MRVCVRCVLWQHLEAYYEFLVTYGTHYIAEEEFGAAIQADYYAKPEGEEHAKSMGVQAHGLFLRFLRVGNFTMRGFHSGAEFVRAWMQLCHWPLCLTFSLTLSLLMSLSLSLTHTRQDSQTLTRFLSLFLSLSLSLSFSHTLTLSHTHTFLSCLLLLVPRFCLASLSFLSAHTLPCCPHKTP